jgi:hypothetical protein
MSEKMKLVVATPCFGGQVTSIYASSIFALQRAVHGMANLELKVLLRDGDALITRARANPRCSWTIPKRRISCSSMPTSASSRSRCSG